jgi:PIN domain-containing protein
LSVIKRKRRVPELKVVFDTNAIYTASGNNLVNNEVDELIRSNSNHKDLLITWYLPEIVRQEREYQLRQHGRTLVQAIRKLEKFVDHEFLPLVDEIVIQRLNERIQTQIDELAINVLPVDVSKVDWRRVMVDAAFRQPPFSPTEREKGFRDALISEAVVQLVESSPQSDNICRIALITGDSLLTEATKAKTVAVQNVRVLSSIDELKGLINTLVSTVDENLIQQLKVEATGLFFEANNREAYFYTEKIKERILEEFAPQLSALPEGADQLKRGKTIVSRPRFKKKAGERIHWVSRVSFRMEAYKLEPLPGTTFSIPLRTLYANGDVIFAVTWSVAVTSANKLSKPKIESVDYIETTWQIA